MPKVVRNNQHGFTAGKLCLTNQRAFCDVVTDLGRKERVYCNFSKALDSVSRSFLTDKLTEYRLGKRT